MGGNSGQIIPGICTQGSLTCRKSSEGRRAEDFLSPFKNTTASTGFEPANLGIRGQHLCTNEAAMHRGLEHVRNYRSVQCTEVGIERVITVEVLHFVNSTREGSMRHKKECPLKAALMGFLCFHPSRSYEVLKGGRKVWVKTHTTFCHILLDCIFDFQVSTRHLCK
jgi:hypothetical protein